MKSCLSCLSLFFMLVIMASLLLAHLGMRFNTSPSIPKGVYWITDEPLARGKYLLFCPEDTPVMREAYQRGILDQGFCPGGFGALMKRVAAIPGDVVSSLSYGVIVNGLLLPFSKPLPQDGHHRPLPQWLVTNHQLKTNEFLVMTDQSPWSFDSRYFGLIKQEQIKAVIKPLWTWPSRTE